VPDLGAEAFGAKAAALLFWVAALLSLERLTYAAVWRAPNAFQRWSERHAHHQSPIDTLAVLFVGFKVLQAAVFLGWCLVHGNGDLSPYSSDARVLLGGILLIAAGQLLNLSVFRALGKTGVFYGNRLGQPVPWQRRFPFTWFEHPQYLGTVLTIWGFFVLMRFPAHDWLFVPVLETVYYAVGAYFERDSIPTDGRLARAKE
jgi:phosphatidyl-N-methylethanolamine N-methyltransferase